MPSDLARFLSQTRADLEKHPGPGPHQNNLTNMSWCMLATIALQDAGCEAVMEELRIHGQDKLNKSKGSERAPFLVHLIRFHDPANPNEPLLTDLRGNDQVETIAAATAKEYGWRFDSSIPVEISLYPLNAAARESFTSEEFTVRLRAFLQSRSLEHDTPATGGFHPFRPRL